MTKTIHSLNLKYNEPTYSFKCTSISHFLPFFYSRKRFRNEIVMGQEGGIDISITVALLNED